MPAALLPRDARLLRGKHSDKAGLIDAYFACFDEMMPGPIAGSVEILAELRARGTPLYALTNFSAETYPPAFARFEFLSWFRGVVVRAVRRVRDRPAPRGLH
jgi:2-haloacid dehalogenase